MRKWFAYILESYDERFPEKQYLIYNKPSIYCTKGEIRDLTLLDMSSNERKVVAKVIGLGYANFKDEEDFRERVSDVVRKKRKEVIDNGKG